MGLIIAPNKLSQTPPPYVWIKTHAWLQLLHMVHVNDNAEQRLSLYVLLFSCLFSKGTAMSLFTFAWVGIALLLFPFAKCSSSVTVWIGIRVEWATIAPSFIFLVCLFLLVILPPLFERDRGTREASSSQVPRPPPCLVYVCVIV